MKRGAISRLLSNLFSRRKKDYVQIYLSRFETLEVLVLNELIGIDFKECYVSVDASVHIQYMNDRKSYEAFFDTVRAYINYLRGMNGMSLVNYDDRINFCVTLKQEIRFDMNTGEYYDKPIKKYNICIIVYYQSGKLEYVPFKETEENQ